ncbi:MAG TPA: hypothetical protein VGK67_36300 [Myxococcales bacterium]|jgi:hypothetical protein
MNPNAAALAFAAALMLAASAPAQARAQSGAEVPGAVEAPQPAADPGSGPAPAPPRTGGAQGADYHGAGGPFAGAILLLPRNNAPLALMTTGGYGYTYFLEGRLRLGGGGQGTVASSVSDGRSGSIGWGGLILGYDPFAFGSWEFPIAVALGGGRVALDRVRADGLVELDSSTFFAAQGSFSVEYRPLRTVKLALQLSWLGAIHNGLAAQALEASLRLVFMLPRPGK